MAQAQGENNSAAISTMLSTMKVAMSAVRAFNAALEALPEAQRAAASTLARDELASQVRTTRPKTAATRAKAVRKSARGTAATTTKAAGDAKPAAEATAPAKPATEAAAPVEAAKTAAPAKRGRKASPKLAAPPAQASSGAAAAT